MIMGKIGYLAASAALFAVPLAAVPAQALTFVLTDRGGVGAGTQALAGFTAATNFWSRVITNNVTINLDVRFASLGPGILGSTGSTTNVLGIQDYIGGLTATGTTNLDSQLVTPTLVPSVFGPGADGVNALISGPRADGTGVALPLTRTLDTDGSGNNAFLSANTSVMKAVGYTPTYTGDAAATQRDGSISFSNNFNFDFNPTDGIAANAIDFIGVAIHEIGHALGFRSGVDVYDTNTAFAGNLNNFAIMTQLDLFRYSQTSAALGINDWAIGGAYGSANAPYFSIDGGNSVFGSVNGPAYFSTGATRGDGRQASHWKDINPPLGLLDPTVAYGQESAVTSLDLAAYDAIGWNINYDVLSNPTRSFTGRTLFGAVPEPATWMMMILGFGFIGSAMRRRRQKVRVSFG